MTGYEVNFDGLVGPTHHYAGLSYGNEASTNNHSQVSNPHLAARQGLEKMKALADMGFKQGVLLRKNVLMWQLYVRLDLVVQIRM